MSNKHLKYLFFHIPAAFVLALFIIAASVTVTLNFRPLYYADIHFLKIAETSGYEESVIKENYDALIDYNSLFNKEPLSFPTLAMSESGRTHFEEVKQIFDLFGWLAIITLPLIIICMMMTRKYHQYTWIGLAGIISIVLPVLLGVLVAVNWDYVFVTFHELVFQNDYWIFDAATDPVITILPDTFFMHCAMMIFVLIIIGSVICLTIHHYLRKAY